MCSLLNLASTLAVFGHIWKSSKSNFVVNCFVAKSFSFSLNQNF
jgi:hypothetical protein